MCFFRPDMTGKLYHMIGHLWWAAAQQSPLMVNYLQSVGKWLAFMDFPFDKTVFPFIYHLS